MHDRLDIPFDKVPEFKVAGQEFSKVTVLPSHPNSLAPGVKLIEIILDNVLSLGSWQIKNGEILTIYGKEPDPELCKAILPILEAVNSRLRDGSNDSQEFLSINSIK